MDQRHTLLIAFLLKGLQYSAAQYYLDVPTKLGAIKNSCVVIPCSYIYSDPKLPSERITGLWYSSIAENHKDIQFIKSRTSETHASFIGDLGNGNCSIKIHKIQPENAKIYKFRVEMEHFKFSYRPSVLLNVSDNPPHPILIFPNQTIVEATEVALKCSTVYTCPSDAPGLVWSSDVGQVNVMFSYEGAGVWKVESEQVINMSRKQDGMSIGCHAIYSSGATSQVVTGSLRIIYKPQILQKSHCKKDLRAIICECAAMANPPANITWHSADANVAQTIGFSINSSSNGSRTVSRLEGTTMPPDIWCRASNIQGSATHIPPVHEKPQILQESQCNTKLGAIVCECAAIANPPPIITWNSTDRNVTEISGFSINSYSRGPKMVSRLEGAAIPPGGLGCTASNTEGSVSQNLPMYVDWTVPILIGAGILVFLVLCVTAAVCAIRKDRENRIVKPNSYIKEDTTCNSDISTKDRKKKKHHARSDAEDDNACDIYENSGNIYLNSVSKNPTEEVYVNAEEEKVKAKKENQEVEEDVYINCLAY